MRTLLFSTFVLLVNLAVGQATYVWNGATSNWATPANWTPPRNAPATNDILTFNASGAIKAITNVSLSQSIGKIIVTGNSTYSFERSTGSSTITLTSSTGNALQIDNGSVLAIGNATIPVNINLPSGGTAEIGGQLNLINGNLDVSNATLLLHTNNTPLLRTNGQLSMNAGSSLLIGNAANQSGPTITLPNGIFVSAPIISSLTINRTNGVTLNQSITIASTATFTLGNLTTTGSGRIRFGTSAANPVEKSNSHITGFAEMLPRAIGTDALDFLGFSMSSGADVGTVSLVRRTGTDGTNTFNANQSIASSWDVATDEPTASRNVRFRWLDSFDNIANPTKKFQVYRFSSGPGWTEVGTLQNLTATSPLRETAIVSVNSVDDTFTVTDESQILPVELTSFFASVSNNVVQLFWTTASELNNDSFTIERSREGEKFEEVTKVKGMGTKLTQTNYSAYDSKPYKGTSYYRLKQTDFDGKSTHSLVITVFVEGTDTWTVYPNPAGGSQFTISVGTDNIDKPILVQMSNSAGQNLFSAQSVVDGQGELVIKSIQPLSPGLYIASITVGNQQKKHKIIIK